MNGPTRSVIPCDKIPTPPLGYSIRLVDQLINSFRGSSFVWNKLTQEDMLGIHPRQMSGEYVAGAVLCEEFHKASFYKDHQLLPVNVLLWLLDNVDQIPSGYEGKIIPFWGTVFKQNDIPVIVVPCLDCRQGKSRMAMLPTGGLFGPESPAAFTKVLRV